MSQLYAVLGLPGFNRFRPKLERYVTSVAGYRKTRFPELSSDLQRRIAREWRRSFEAWGYRRQP